MLTYIYKLVGVALVNAAERSSTSFTMPRNEPASPPGLSVDLVETAADLDPANLTLLAYFIENLEPTRSTNSDDHSRASPEGIPDIVDHISRLDEQERTALVNYLRDLETAKRDSDDSTQDDSDVQPDATDSADDDEALPDRPDGVPTKASITTKTIKGNQYDYWQWRDGDKIKSKYIGPSSS